jgi:O-acetyl-ADP-ribose deacetylase (regulator of RNase III)
MPEQERSPTLFLTDIDLGLIDAWRSAFSHFPEVHVCYGDILAVAECCIVSPANSYGFMDGGIDLSYRDFFGVQIERRVRDAISHRQDGLLPVGAAIVVGTGHERIPYLVVAPTMTMPEAVPEQNSGRAMYAALRAVKRHGRIDKVYCPGLATGIGKVLADRAAFQMAAAYADFKDANSASGSKTDPPQTVE